MSRFGISKGVASACPSHRLLGTYRDSIPAYASTTTFATVEEFLDVADQCLELGFPAIKLHASGRCAAPTPTYVSAFETTSGLTSP